MARVIGMSHDGIAAELGIAEGVVRTRVSRAEAMTNPSRGQLGSLALSPYRTVG